MFRVPVDGDNPTFDDTFKVGLGKWLTSSAAERKEWARRRNAAARLARTNQLTRLGAPTDENAFGKFVLGPGSISRGTTTRPLSGVTATVGELQRSKLRKGATVVGVLGGSALAAVNAAGRIGAKQLTITGPGFEWTAEVPAHKVDQAVAFAERVNAAARGA